MTRVIFLAVLATMLVGDVPGVPLRAPRDIEQRHLHHIDHGQSV